jgi:RimJ/RimL family protein N-acetyltransferase
MITIRQIKEKDAEEILNLCKKIDAETKFMMFEPNERPTTIEEQKDEIKEILLSDNQIILVAEKDGELVGYLAAYGGRYKRNRHSAYIITGVLKDFTFQGIGARLLEELERWARKNNVHRLELTVMAHNEAAIALYRKMGFEIEGRKLHALFVNGSYVDEYCMAKLLT